MSNNDTLRDEALDLTKAGTCLAPVLFLMYSITGLSPTVSAIGTLATVMLFLIGAVTLTAVAFNAVNT
jgi:hypothetical protein